MRTFWIKQRMQIKRGILLLLGLILSYFLFDLLNDIIYNIITYNPPRPHSGPLYLPPLPKDSNQFIPGSIWDISLVRKPNYIDFITPPLATPTWPDLPPLPKDPKSPWL